ncbi:helix-turn-helix transcriptional regulator [Ancylobacter terrae]|uniref:helix-turn-helix transcriptional regulator n=1 Tax=Ancylobacter sp. sgz301288 TaxID=3342077 RepID=UPI0038582C5A
MSWSGSADDLTDRIYEAAVLPDMWPGVLGDICAVATAREGVLISLRDDTAKWIASSPFMDGLTREYYTYEGAQERLMRLLAVRRAGFVTDEDVFSPAEIAALPVFADFLMPRGYGRGVATVVNIPDGSQIVFHAEGDHRRGPLPSATIASLDALRPHLARAALLSTRLDFERARTAVETLAAIGMPACAVARRGTVIVANRLFDQSADYWTTRGGDEIALADRRSNEGLREALARLETMAAVLSLPMVVTPEVSPAVLHVIPVRRAASDLFSRAMAILVLSVAGARSHGPASLIQSLFDLTPAEANVATRIADGRTAEEIAQADQKSVDTVRNQLKAVLQKTGCHRQSDLVRLLGQLVIG